MRFLDGVQNSHRLPHRTSSVCPNRRRPLHQTPTVGLWSSLIGLAQVGFVGAGRYLNRPRLTTSFFGALLGPFAFIRTLLLFCGLMYRYSCHLGLMIFLILLILLSSPFLYCWASSCHWAFFFLPKWASTKIKPTKFNKDQIKSNLKEVSKRKKYKSTHKLKFTEKFLLKKKLQRRN